MPAIEHECMEWLDNDVMPQVHLEAMKMGFHADVMYKPESGPPKEPCPPMGAPTSPPHASSEERACKWLGHGLWLRHGSSASAGGHVQWLMRQARERHGKQEAEVRAPQTEGNIDGLRARVHDQATGLQAASAHLC